MKIALSNDTVVDTAESDVFVYGAVIKNIIHSSVSSNVRDSLFIMKDTYNKLKYKGFAMQYMENNTKYWAYFSRETLYRKANIAPGFGCDKFNGKEVITVKTYEQDSRPGQIAGDLE